MKRITAEEFDRKFEAGEDITSYVDLSKARRPGRMQPDKMIQQLHQTRARLLDEVRRIDKTLETITAGEYWAAGA
jgi:hypothetical protein